MGRLLLSSIGTAAHTGVRGEQVDSSLEGASLPHHAHSAGVARSMSDQRRHAAGYATIELAAALTGSDDGRSSLQIAADVPAMASGAAKQLSAFSGLMPQLKAALVELQPFQRLHDALVEERLLSSSQPLMWSAFV